MNVGKVEIERLTYENIRRARSELEKLFSNRVYIIDVVVKRTGFGEMKIGLIVSYSVGGLYGYGVQGYVKFSELDSRIELKSGNVNVYVPLVKDVIEAIVTIRNAIDLGKFVIEILKELKIPHEFGNTDWGLTIWFDTDDKDLLEKWHKIGSTTSTIPYIQVLRARL